MPQMANLPSKAPARKSKPATSSKKRRDEDIVKKIVAVGGPDEGHRNVKFKVRWGAGDTTWEPLAHIYETEAFEIYNSKLRADADRLRRHRVSADGDTADNYRVWYANKIQAELDKLNEIRESPPPLPPPPPPPIAVPHRNTQAERQSNSAPADRFKPKLSVSPFTEEEPEAEEEMANSGEASDDDDDGAVDDDDNDADHEDDGSANGIDQDGSVITGNNMRAYIELLKRTVDDVKAIEARLLRLEAARAKRSAAGDGGGSKRSRR